MLKLRQLLLLVLLPACATISHQASSPVHVPRRYERYQPLPTSERAHFTLIYCIGNARNGESCARLTYTSQPNVRDSNRPTGAYVGIFSDNPPFTSYLLTTTSERP
jgi:hypothetical protein